MHDLASRTPFSRGLKGIAMDRQLSSGHSTEVREDRLSVATLLAFSGGYIDAYAWINHGVFANAQTANLVFLVISATSGQWVAALHYVPPLIAFMCGVIVACSLRHFAGAKAAQISLVMEISFLCVVAILHNRLPELAGTLGISFVAAIQASSFPRVEQWSYNSVRATTNLRNAIEGMFAAVVGTPNAHPFRLPLVFAAVCLAFVTGAASGAYATARFPTVALVVPVASLLIAALKCGKGQQAFWRSSRSLSA
jgi:uncharacterized membrane protein YoaK (UPF0700 family)